MKVKVVREYEVEAPEYTTHFSGDLLGGEDDPPVWWRWKVSSGGIHGAWWFWNRTQKRWHYHRDGKPDILPTPWVKKIEEVNP